MPAPAPATELLARTQQLIERLYGIESPYRADAFLLADADVAHALHGEAPRSDEMLLVSENDDGLELSLFLHPDLLERLAEAAPHEALGEDGLDDFWSVVEGVSHFVYLTWNAARSRSVTPLELELQGEVDKYAVTALTWQHQRGGSPRGLHRLLFEHAQVDDFLPEDLRERYRDANRYAGRYCLAIERRYLTQRRAGLIDELRSFYREDRGGKLARIGTP